MQAKGKLYELLGKREADITSKWLELQASGGKKLSAAEQGETTKASRDFMAAFKAATQKGSTDDITGPEWDRVKEIIADLSSKRAKGGYSPSETASFVFSLKQPVFSVLRDEYGKDPEVLGDAIWESTVLLDKLGLLTTESYQKTREDVISRQQQELLELSTPVVRLWENVLALPLIPARSMQRTHAGGDAESSRMRLSKRRSGFRHYRLSREFRLSIRWLAQHLLKATVAAARLMWVQISA